MLTQYKNNYVALITVVSDPSQSLTEFVLSVPSCNREVPLSPFYRWEIKTLSLSVHVYTAIRGVVAAHVGIPVLALV